MPDVAGGWLCLLLRTLGGIFGREILYLDVAGLDTPIWDVLAPQGEQERALNRLTMRPRSLAFLIRQAVPVGLAGARFYCWARCWLVGLGSSYFKISTLLATLYLYII